MVQADSKADEDTSAVGLMVESGWQGKLWTRLWRRGSWERDAETSYVHVCARVRCMCVCACAIM